MLFVSKVCEDNCVLVYTGKRLLDFFGLLLSIILAIIPRHKIYFKLCSTCSIVFYSKPKAFHLTGGFGKASVLHLFI